MSLSPMELTTATMRKEKYKNKRVYFVLLSFFCNFAVVKRKGMETSDFFAKFKSWYLWGNLIAMGVVFILLCVGMKYAMDVYTHHGEEVTIPSLRNKSVTEAMRILEGLGMEAVVADTGYVKTLPADCILEQSPAAGRKVKTGRMVYLTINASKSPTISLPDIIDNSSLREAMAKLTAMGFKLGQPEFVPGEKDWVYGVLCKGRRLAVGDKVSVDDYVIIQVGNGLRDGEEEVGYVDEVDAGNYEDSESYGDFDDFEEVTGP